MGPVNTKTIIVTTGAADATPLNGLHRSVAVRIWQFVAALGTLPAPLAACVLINLLVHEHT